MVSDAKVSLKGEVSRDVEADSSGNYLIAGIPTGSYEISAKADGLSASQSIVVPVGEDKYVPLQLQMNVVAVSTVVKASSEPHPMEESSGNQTIGSTAVTVTPNRDEHFETLLPLVPGVIRGKDGLIKMKGAASTQNGWLVNSANVTDPATGAEAFSIPVDVVSSVQVISTPYDPQFGGFTGAVTNVETRQGDFEKMRVSVQNLLPRLRRLDGSIMGIESVTPRATISFPIMANRVAFTQSVDYRYERLPVDSLPPLVRDTKQESFDSYTQFDATLGKHDTATAWFAIFPGKFDYVGLNTFNTQKSTPNLHQRGFQSYLQERSALNGESLLTSQFSYLKFNADLLPNDTAPYELQVETTTGGFFNRQHRETSRTDWQETLQSSPKQFHGTHTLKTGIEFTHSSYDGFQQSNPVTIIGAEDAPVETITFGQPAEFEINQYQGSWFAGDRWTLSKHFSLEPGVRFNVDSITNSIGVAPRLGFIAALTRDERTLLKGGGGFFYGSVPLNIPSFDRLPSRTVTRLDMQGDRQVTQQYANLVPHGLQVPRNEVWTIELDREISNSLMVRASWEQRKTVHEFVLTTDSSRDPGAISLTNHGSASYREFQITARYQVHHSTLYSSYVHSRAYGDLNDFNQYFGNNPQAVLLPNQRARLPFDAPNRFLAWAQISAPWKVTVSPLVDVHDGFPYSPIDQYRDYVGAPNTKRFPTFGSMDMQILREARLPLGGGREQHARVGFSTYNIFNCANPRDVQSVVDSDRFGQFFNGMGRSYRAKLILEF
jgi:hypothetical protein